MTHPATTSKVVSMVLLFFISFGLGLMPLMLDPNVVGKTLRRVTIQSALLCFGSGVLLSTCTVHILPEVTSFVHTPCCFYHP